VVRLTPRLLYLQDENTQFLSQKKLGNSVTNLSRSISIPRLLTGYSKPSSDYAMMTTAPDRSIHVDLETSELKKYQSSASHSGTLYARQKSSHQHIKLSGSKSVGSEVTLRLKAVNDISTKHLWNDDCQETKNRRRLATQSKIMSQYRHGDKFRLPS